MSEEKQEATPPVEAPAVDPKEAKLVKMLTTYDPETQEIRVQNVQNLTRPHAMYMTSRVLKTYEDDETALAVISKLSNVVEQSKSSKADKLWVPGAKNNVLTVIAADLHISEDRRYGDTANLLLYILEQISRVLPKYFIILGDIFDKRRPSPRELRLLNKWLLQMLERVENVILLEGNHDLDRDVSALSYLQDLVVPGVKIVRPPYKLNGYYFDHIQLVGALADNGIALHEGKVLSKVIEANPDCHTFAFGHLHKPQVLQEKPLAFYAGSLDKISFAEVDDKKRIWVFDGDELQSCIDLPTRPMYQYNLSVVEGVDLETPWNSIDVSGAMIKIVFSGTREVLKTINSAHLHKDLVDRGVFSLKIVFDVTNKSAPRNEIINESVTEQAALEEYFKDRPNKEQLVTKGLQLIKEIENE